MLKTEPGLPAHLKQCIFAEEIEWLVLCRHSSDPGNPGVNDRIPQSRGFAVKVFDVHGEFFDAGKDIPVQDMEFNSTPSLLHIADAKTAREILGLRIKYGKSQSELYKYLELPKDTKLQKVRDNVHNTHMEATRQYSQTAYRFGDYIMKFYLVPNTETQRKLYEKTIKTSDGPDILYRWLQNFHREHNTEYLFQVQLCKNPEE
ncbi:hypothetical protein B7463_g4583, partial [Scytalidium lignicola]